MRQQPELTPIPRTRRLASHENQTAMSSLLPAADKMSLSASTSWQRALKNSLGSFCCDENTERNSALYLQSMNAATLNGPVGASFEAGTRGRDDG